MEKRIEYIDTAKGICMLLIILGHCATGTDTRHGSFLITWIYSFHTTTFFVITGMLMEHTKEYARPLKKLLMSNIKRILIPYFLFQIIYSIWYCIINGFSNIKWLVPDIFLLVDWDYASWFLLALFLSKTIVLVVYKIFKNQSVAKCLLLLLFLLGIMLSKYNLNPPLSWIYHQGLRSIFGVGFLVMGTILYKYKNLLNNKIILIMSLIGSLFTSYMNGLVSIFNLTLGNLFLYLVSTICGAIFIISLSTHIRNIFITFFGKESIVAMGTHQLIIWTIPIKTIFLWFIVVPLTMIPMYLYSIIKQSNSH